MGFQWIQILHSDPRVDTYRNYYRKYTINFMKLMSNYYLIPSKFFFVGISLAL